MTRRPDAPMADITDCVIEDARWNAENFPALAETAARCALNCVGIAADGWEIAVLACDDARIAVLNADFRGKPMPTNVLSWPSFDLAPEFVGDTPDLPPLPPDSLGDIAIAFDTCAREAQEQGIVFADHVTHLMVHGVLHLLGYDHIEDEDAALMEGLEIKALASLGIANPY